MRFPSQNTPAGSSSNGFTLIEILLIGFWLGSGILGAYIFRRYFHFKWAWAFGAFAGLAFLPILAELIDFMHCLFIKGIPSFPFCRRGKCHRQKDYELEYKDRIQDFVWVCRCGENYDKQGRRFVRLNEGGQWEPYLIWIPFKGWRSDK